MVVATPTSQDDDGRHESPFGLAVMVLGVTRLAGRAAAQPPAARESPSTRENDVPSSNAVTGSEHQHR